MFSKNQSCGRQVVQTNVDPQESNSRRILSFISESSMESYAPCLQSSQTNARSQFWSIIRISKQLSFFLQTKRLNINDSFPRQMMRKRRAKVRKPKNQKL